MWKGKHFWQYCCWQGDRKYEKDKLKAWTSGIFGSIQYTIDSVFHNDFYCHKQACVSKIFVI